MNLTKTAFTILLMAWCGSTPAVLHAANPSVTHVITGSVIPDPEFPEMDVSVSVPRYSEANGTLAGVEVTLDYDFSSSYEFQNDPAGAGGQVEYTPHAEMVFSTWTATPTNIGGESQLPAQQQNLPAGSATVNDAAAGAGQANGTSPHLSDFVGTGWLNGSVELFDHSTVENLSATPGLGTSTQTISANFTLTVTYSYFPVAPGPARIHVNAAAAPGGNGTTWSTAFNSLSEGLAAAGPGSEVWVAAGTYTPGTVRTETFGLPPGVTLLGGFAGGEVDGTARDAVANLTILSGDLNGDDASGGLIDNAYNILTVDGLLQPVTIDGFTITAGRAVSGSWYTGIGAGLIALQSADVSVTNCKFDGNLAHTGGAIYEFRANMTIDGCEFTNNTIFGGRGGAIAHYGDSSMTNESLTMTIINSTFDTNVALYQQNQGVGGAIYSDYGAPVTIDRCHFENNEARWRFISSGTAYGGACFIAGFDSTITNSTFVGNEAMIGGALSITRRATVANCAFIGNTAIRRSNDFDPVDFGGYGGAAHFWGNGSLPNSDSRVVNCTFHANHAPNVGGILGHSALVIENSILWTNTHTEPSPALDSQLQGDPVIRNSTVLGLNNPQNGSISADPLFVDPDGADNILGNADDNLTLSPFSPCIDTGDSAAAIGSLDLAGDQRIANAGVDMGAFEYQGSVVIPDNDPPTATFTFTVDDNTVTFTDTSTDPDGSVVAWSWNFGDGSISQAQNPVHTFATNGSYTVQMIVQDDDGALSVAGSALVTVSGLGVSVGAAIAEEVGFPTSQITGIADVNSDGHLDVLAIGSGDQVNDVQARIKFGDGLGRFEDNTEFGNNERKADIAFGDFNEDGHVDVVVPDFYYSSDFYTDDRRMPVYLNDGEGNFTAPASHVDYLATSSSYYPRRVATEDFNNDGHLDLILTMSGGGSPPVALYAGGGTGTFGAGINLGTAYQPVDLVTGDFDLDGNADYVITFANYSTVNWGDGAGSFSTSAAGALQAKGKIELGDFNADGIEDFIDAGNIYLNNGDRTFDPGVPHGGSGPFAVADFNNDGLDDFATANGTTVRFYLRDMTGGFVQSGSGTVAISAEQIVAGDWNEDGWPDVFVEGDIFNEDAQLSILLQIPPPGGAPDTTPPVVSITSPSGASSVANTVAVQMDATDNLGVLRVTLYDDGAFVGTAASPFLVSWDTRDVDDGSHVLTAIAVDAAGNETTSDPITVTVNNEAPTFTSAPLTPAINVGSLHEYTAIASGIAPISFSIVTAPSGVILDSATGLLSWTPTPAQLGLHTITIRASNSAGQADQTFNADIVDTEVPSNPVNDGISEITQTSARISWLPSTDNVAVDHYVLWYFRKINRFPGHWTRSTTTTTDTSLVLNPSPTARYTPRYAVAAVDAAGNESGRSAEFAIILASPDALDTWRQAHFSAADLANPALESSDWGFTADPDKDGLNNDAEYGLGTDPLVPDASSAVTHGVDTTGGSKLLTLTFNRRINDPAIEVAAELSENLGGWDSSSGVMEVTSTTPLGNGFEQVTVRETLRFSTAQELLRPRSREAIVAMNLGNNRIGGTGRTAGLIVAAGILAFPGSSSLRAEVTTYTNETAYEVELLRLGYTTVVESFEDDVAWGAVRSTIVGGSMTAPSVTSQGITWTHNFPGFSGNNITTGLGAARTGNYGLYALPHGNYLNGACTVPGVCGDGIKGSTPAGTLMFAVGGWVRTNTPPAEVGVFLDGAATAVDFGDVPLSPPNSQRFFGVIDTAGFNGFEFRELEGTKEDAKFIFSDDFTIGLTATGCGSNSPPSAAFTFAQTDADVTFTDASGDTDGTVVQWLWDFGDGNYSSLQNPSHSYASNGTYSVILYVRDDGNCAGASPAQLIFVTSFPPTDIAITNPTNGAVVSGTITLQVSIMDPPSEVEQVTYFLDDNEFDNSEEDPFSLVWDTTATTDGIHTLKARLTKFDETEIFSDPVTITVSNSPPPTPLELWRIQNFTQADLGDPAKEETVWGTGADPDGDGLINDGEFGVGTDPNDPSDGDGGVVFGTVDGSGQVLLTFTYRRRNDDPALLVEAAISEDLSSWDSSPGRLQVLTAVDQGDGYDLVTVVEVPGPTPRSRGFGTILILRTAL